MTATPPQFAVFEGRPVRFDNHLMEAWSFGAGVDPRAWTKIDFAEVFTGAHVLTEAAFADRFDHLQLPSLPSNAFQESGRPDRAAE